MGICYYHQGFTLEIYIGKLHENIELTEKKNPLLWLPLLENFTDKVRFADVHTIAYIMNVALQYPLPEKQSFWMASTSMLMYAISMTLGIHYRKKVG